jgi:hypothetical protein
VLLWIAESQTMPAVGSDVRECRPTWLQKRGGVIMKRYRIALSAMVLIAMGLIGFSEGQNTRVYELRTYTTLPGRLPALNKRFAEHTIELFEKHGMKSEIYWAPTDEPLKDNTLIYVISHESREAADKNWKEFQADPDWIKARDESEADGKILAKPPERVFMTVTAYSPKK